MKISGLKKILVSSPSLRNRLLLLLVILGILNIGVWVVTFYFTKSYPFILGLVSLSYALGLRHAVDADHIAAIDNTTRKLIQEGQKPVAIGFFFALGHSTIVILLSLAIALSSSFIKTNLPQWAQIGSLIGASISSIFLLIIGIINLFIFLDLYKLWRHTGKTTKTNQIKIDEQLYNRGLIARLLKPLLKTIGKSHNMYPIGFLFGLGFDTASEVALLSLSALSGAQNFPLICIMLLPLAFTAGMTLIDSIDGILMLGTYGWAYIKPARKLYYNLSITFMSVIVALFIGTTEALHVISSQINNNTGIFWLANKFEFEYLGYFIIAAFLLSFICSWILSRIKK